IVEIRADRQPPRLISDIGRIRDYFPWQLILKAERILVRVGKRPIEILVARGQSEIRGQALAVADRREQSLRKRIRERNARRQTTVGRSDDGRAAAVARAGPDRILTQVNQPITAAQHQFGADLIRSADPRLEIVQVAMEGLPIVAARSCVEEPTLETQTLHLAGYGTRLVERKSANHAVVSFRGRSFVVPPEAEIQRQPPGDLPVILEVETVVSPAHGRIDVLVD